MFDPTAGKKKWFRGDAEDFKRNVFVLCGTNSDQIIGLNRIGIYPRVMAIKNKGDTLLSLPPGELVKEMSAATAGEVSKFLAEKLDFDVIIACHTVVVVDGDVIEKPMDMDDAFEILSRLNNRWHSIFTGVTLLDANRRMDKFHVETKIKFGDIPAEMFREYVRTGECFNRVGAYNVRGRGADFIESFHGTLNNAAGFPVHELQIKLREFLSRASASTTKSIEDLSVPVEMKKERPIPKPRRLPPSKPVECYDIKDEDQPSAINEDQPSAINEDQPSASTEGKSATEIGGAVKAHVSCFDEPWTSRKMFPNQRIIMPPREVIPDYIPMTLEEIYYKIHGRHRHRAPQRNPHSFRGTRPQGPQFRAGQYPQVPRPQFVSPQLQASQQFRPRPQFGSPQLRASQQFRPRQQQLYQQNQTSR